MWYSYGVRETPGGLHRPGHTITDQQENIMSDTKPTTTDAAETVETAAAEAKRKGTQLSTIIHDDKLVAQLTLVKRARDLKNPSEVVREALEEYAANHAEEVEKFKAFFNITD